MRDEETQLKVAFYIRVSTDEQAEKYGVDLQKSALEGLIKSRGMLEDGRPKMVLAKKNKNEDYIYYDEGISGSDEIEKRPGFAQILEDLNIPDEQSRPFDVIAVYKIDRFARRLKILLRVIEFLDDKKIKFLSANESIDTSTPFGRAMLGIIGVIAELEIETTKQRTDAGRAEAIKDGKFMGSQTSFGYVKDGDGRPKIFPKEAKIIESIFDKFTNQRNSPQQIADYLTENEYLTPAASAIKYNKKKGDLRKKNAPTFWRAEKVRDILSDELYIGKYYYRKNKDGKKVPKSEWKLSPYRQPSIIDSFTFKKAQHLLGQSKQLANSRNKTIGKHLYLLSGLLRCGHCQENKDDSNENLATWTGDRKKITKKNTRAVSYSYKCGRKKSTKYSITCGTIPIPAKQIEEYVVNIIKNLIDNPEVVYNHYHKLKSTKLAIKGLVEQRDRWRELLNNLPSRENNLKQQNEDNVIDNVILNKKLAECKEKKKSFEKSIEKAEYQIAQNSLSKGYMKSLELFSEKYVKTLKDLYSNRKEVFDIIHMLIDKIIVYSRPVRKTDKIAGRKKEGERFIPNKIEIEFKLPQDILNDLAIGFGVKISDLWVNWDSNPGHPA